MYASKLKIKTFSVNAWRSLCWWPDLSDCLLTSPVSQHNRQELFTGQNCIMVNWMYNQGVVLAGSWSLPFDGDCKSNSGPKPGLWGTPTLTSYPLVKGELEIITIWYSMHVLSTRLKAAEWVALNIFSVMYLIWFASDDVVIMLGGTR